MPAPGGSPPDRLPIGQILYAIQDTTLICVPQGASTAQYHRVSFKGSEETPKASLDDPIDLGPIDDIRSARAVTDGEGKQEVVFLSKTGLSFIGMQDQISRLTTVSANVDDAVLVIGLDPLRTTKRSLALLVKGDTGFAVAQVDMECGVREAPRQLPLQVRGTAVAAELVRRNSSTMLVIATIEEGSLLVHAVAWDVLAPKVGEILVKTLTLGSVFSDPARMMKPSVDHLDPHLREWTAGWPGILCSRVLARHAQVAATVTTMRAGSSDQQLAVAWADPIGAPKIALVGWGNGGEATVVATAVPEITFAFPLFPAYRLAAADLLHNGTEQLVLGYSSFYGGKYLINPSIALMLFTLDESVRAAPNLKCESKYAADWDIGFTDLHIGAGVFGTSMGVQVIDTRNQGYGRVVGCSFVPVHPNLRGFPPMTGDRPGDTLFCDVPGRVGGGLTDIDLEEVQFLAFPSDLSGQSVVLGPPRLTQREGCTQILAIIQAAPFDRRFVSTMPSVSYSRAYGDASGCSVSKDKSWTLSEDTSVNLALGPLNLSESTHDSYLNSVGKMQDDSSTSNVAFHSSIVEQDYVLTYEIGYDVWSYPVVRSSVKDKSGEILVIFPHDAKPTLRWLPAHTYGYRPRSEVGMLLSYVEVDKEGYTAENALFETDAISVSGKLDSSTLTFDKSYSKMDTDSKHFSVLNSASNHLAFTASTDLFDFLPASFGLNLGSSHSYSDSSIKTTHLTVHSSLNLSVSGGSVKDVIYEYTITPYIYQHEKLGCLVLAWGVEPIGHAWQARSAGGDATVASPQVCLIRPVPKSKDLVFQQFSRSISFVENKEGTVDIRVEIFNNSYSPAMDVSCKFFLGKPVEEKGRLTLPGIHLDTVKLDLIKALDRPHVILAGQKLTKPIYVTVQLFIGTIPGEIYWGVYPTGRFFSSERNISQN